MTQVNSPFVLPKIRPINEYSELQNNYLFQLERILQQLYQRSGGQSDDVQDKSLDFSSAIAPVIAQKISEDIPDFTHYASALSSFLSEKNIYTVASSQAAIGPGIYICTNTSQITLTLPSSPADGDEIIVKRTGGSVIISGSIDGDTSLELPVKYDAPQLIYTTAAGEWSIV